MLSVSNEVCSLLLAVWLGGEGYERLSTMKYTLQATYIPIGGAYDISFDTVSVHDGCHGSNGFRR